MRLDLNKLDSLLGANNIAKTGEDIRAELASHGYFVCYMPGGTHSGYCPTCGCEPTPGGDQE
jgi:hypothetical protein